MSKRRTKLPPVTGIKDPEVRKVLTDIIQFLRECSGEAGDSEGRFVTKAELVELGNKIGVKI